MFHHTFSEIVRTNLRKSRLDEIYAMYYGHIKFIVIYLTHIYLLE